MEIKLSNVSYKDNLVEVNYTFKDKQITSIVGKSGSGKSLIGYVIMDLISCSKGCVMVDGKSSYDKYQFLKDVGYVFQNPKDHFFCETVYEEIAFGLKQFKFKLDKMENQVMNSLKMVGLDSSIAQKKINCLSSGEMERVAIASSLVLNPKVLILDEPTVYMDYHSIRDLVKLIKMLKRKYNKTIIVMSNDMDFVYSISDNYVLIDQGRIIKSGKFKDQVDNDNIMKEYGMERPLIHQFIGMVKDRKNVSLKYTSDIDELVEEVLNCE